MFKTPDRQVESKAQFRAESGVSAKPLLRARNDNRRYAAEIAAPSLRASKKNAAARRRPKPKIRATTQTARGPSEIDKNCAVDVETPLIVRNEDHRFAAASERHVQSKATIQRDIVGINAQQPLRAGDLNRMFARPIRNAQVRRPGNISRPVMCQGETAASRAHTQPPLRGGISATSRHSG